MMDRLGGMPRCVRRIQEERRNLELHQRMLMTYGGGSSAPLVDAADFDGTNDYLSRGAFTGTANSKTGIFSGWFKLDVNNSVNQAVLFTGDKGASTRALEVFYDWGGGVSQGFWIFGDDFSAFNIRANVTLDTTSWWHVLFAWDLAAGTLQAYVNDTDVKSVADSASTNVNVAYTSVTTWYVGRTVDDVTRFNGGMAEVYFAPGQFLDMSVGTNRRKFITATGKPENLGSDGSTPTGTVPKCFLHLADAEAAANFATNRSGNGNFTVTGALSTYASSPSG